MCIYICSWNIGGERVERNLCVRGPETDLFSKSSTLGHSLQICRLPSLCIQNTCGGGLTRELPLRPGDPAWKAADYAPPPDSRENRRATRPTRRVLIPVAASDWFPLNESSRFSVSGPLGCAGFHYSLRHRGNGQWDSCNYERLLRAGSQEQKGFLKKNKQIRNKKIGVAFPARESNDKEALSVSKQRPGQGTWREAVGRERHDEQVQGARI